MLHPLPQSSGHSPTCCDAAAPGKRERNRLERRAAIVAVARRLFLEQGYAATTMSAVAEAMGGSKATLWAHFSSKEALFAAVADAMVGGFAEQMEELLGGQRFSVPGLRDFCERFIEKLLSPESTTLFRMVMAESGRSPELGALFFARGPAQTVLRLGRYFGGAYPPERAAALARVTVNALVGHRTAAMMDPSHAEPQVLAAFFEELVTNLRLE